MSPVDGYDLFEHEHKEERTTGTEESIVDLEKESEFLRLTCLHNFANAEDSGKISGKDGENDWLGRKRSGATNIMGEVVRNMRDGDMLEDEVGEGGHSGTDAKHGGVRVRSGPISGNLNSMSNVKSRTTFKGNYPTRQSLGDNQCPPIHELDQENSLAVTCLSIPDLFIVENLPNPHFHLRVSILSRNLNRICVQT